MTIRSLLTSSAIRRISAWASPSLVVVLDVDGTVRGVNLAQFSLERFVLAFVSFGDELDGRLPEVYRILRNPVRIDDMEYDHPGLVLDGERAGRVEGFL